MTTKVDDSKTVSVPLSSEVNERAAVLMTSAMMQTRRGVEDRDAVDIVCSQARSLDEIPPSRRFTAVAGNGKVGETRVESSSRRRRATAPARHPAAAQWKPAANHHQGHGEGSDGHFRVQFAPNCSPSSFHSTASTSGLPFDHVASPILRCFPLRVGVPDTRPEFNDRSQINPRRVKSDGPAESLSVLNDRDSRAARTKFDDSCAVDGDASLASVWHDDEQNYYDSGTEADNRLLSDGWTPFSPANRGPPMNSGIAAELRGGEARLSFGVKPARRWSLQRAIDDASADDCGMTSRPTPTGDAVKSAFSAGHSKVIGAAAGDAERAVSATAAVTSETRGSVVRKVSMSTCGQYVREHIMSFSQPSDNRLTMKLFGNKNAFARDKLRRSQERAAWGQGQSGDARGGASAEAAGPTLGATSSWLIHPCSNFRLYWDLFMLVLLMANMITLPIAISFFNDDLSTHWIIFNGICDTVFLTDLIINFRTGIIADKFVDDIIMEPIAIAKHYMKTWFLVDLISSVPLDYIIVALSPETSASQVMHAGRALRMFRLIKLLSLLRLLRFSRLVRYITQWQEFLAVAGKFMRIFNLVCLILLMAHWNGCLQWLVPMLQDFPPDSWPALEGLQQAGFLEQYTWALFKALSHMLCIGFGRYPPQSTTDVWLTIVSMLTGATCYALFVGHSTTVIQSFDTSKRLYREKFKQVEEYMMYRKLPRKLRNNITDYYEHRYRGKMFDETSILNEVNECLKEEIINYNCRSLVAAVPFFTHADHNFVSDVITKLQCEVFLPGDVIIRYGTVGNKMYFIQEGIVDIITEDQQVVTSLSDGSYFGEICLLTNSRRVASVRAETYCNLFSLSVEHFHSVLDRYPDVKKTLETVAVERLNITARHAVTSSSEIDDARSPTEAIEN